MRSMLKNLFYTLLFVLFSAEISPHVHAQQAAFKSFDEQNGQYHFDTETGRYVLVFFNSGILEVNFYPTGEEEESWAQSHAVVMQPEFPTVEVEKSDEGITLHSDGIRVRFDTARSSFSFYYRDKPLLQEQNGFTINRDENGEEDRQNGFSVDFRISESELLMGGGARALGMNRRGHRLELYNRAHYGYETYSELMNFTLPMVLSSNMYALHFDNPTTGYLDLDSQNDHTIQFEAHSGRKTYQLIAGDRWEDIIRNYTQLTGFQPLPPRWTFGNFSSRFGYRSQEEALETISIFRELEVPVDAIILDLYWFGQEVKGTMGNLAFDDEMWPDPKSMVEELEADGVKTVLITEPFVLTTSNRWDEVVEAGVMAEDTLGNPATYEFFFGNTGLIDLFKPEGEEWFWNIYREKIDRYGIHGWWGDLGEPEVHPDWVRHHTGSAREVHNIYGHQWAKMVHDGYLKDYPDERPFNLMRAGYSGSQRYGMIPWTGDVSRSWGGLKPQPEISLQMGLQGIAYMHSDLGGFAGANRDRELYTRWMQYGVFQPIYRPHAQDDLPSEPVFWDDETVSLTKKAIELRYQLLPYIYTAAFQNSQSGIPFMRPLFFEEPDNFEFYNIAENYLFGDDLLVAPVLRKGEKEVTLHTPNTANWYDFRSSEKFEGGKSYRVKTDSTHIPVFVRGGAVIPMADLVQTTDNYSVDHLTLHYFYDEESKEIETTIYHDDGFTRESYERGKYEILRINSVLNQEANSFTMHFEKEVGPDFESEFSALTLNIRNIEECPANVRLDDQDLAFECDLSREEVVINRIELSGLSHSLRVWFEE